MPAKRSKRNTRERVLDAAGQLFAENGFKETSVRDICERARANLSAIHYYFKGKQGLYRQTFAHVLYSIEEKFPMDGGEGGLPAGADPEEKLRTFVSAFISRASDPDRPSWHYRLIHREMMNPTEMGQKITGEMIGRNTGRLKSIVEKILGPGAEDMRAALCAYSVIGQCLFYVHRRTRKGKGLPGHDLFPREPKEIIAHIFRFSLAGMRSTGGEKAQ